jgi:hypothetical protein
MRVNGSYNTGHCHGLTGIAGYVVVRVRTRPGPSVGGGGGETRADLAVLEGAGQYLQARERARSLDAQLGKRLGERVRFGVDVVYTDGCRMPW